MRKEKVQKSISVLAARFINWREGEDFPRDTSPSIVLFKWLDAGGFDSVGTEERFQALTRYLGFSPLPEYSDYQAWGFAKKFDTYMKTSRKFLARSDFDNFVGSSKRNPDAIKFFETPANLEKTVDFLMRKDLGFGYHILPLPEFSALKPPEPPEKPVPHFIRLKEKKGRDPAPD